MTFQVKVDDGPRKTSIVMGKAFLKAVDERDHFGLFRPVFADEPDPETGEISRRWVEDMGPLQVFREAREDDSVSIQTFHPITKRVLKLVKVWDARQEMNDRSES